MNQLLVSAIMPTRGRRDFAEHAVRSFLAQTYSARELVVLDDAEDASFPEGLDHPQISYWRLAARLGRLSIPDKRNRCCQMAKGQIVMHWDSDDWSDPGRMADQVAQIQSAGKAVTGYESILFVQIDTKPAKAYRYPGWKSYVVGTSLCFTRAWWEANPFDETLRSRGEDNAFVIHASDSGQLATFPGENMIVARIHKGNTAPKSTEQYVPIALDAVPAGFFQ